MEETVSEILFSKPQSSLSSGFIGTLVCWFFGILLSVLAVIVALNGDLAARAAGLVLLAAGACLCGWARSAGIVWKLRLAAVLLGGTMLLLIGELTLRKFSNYPSAPPPLKPHPTLGFVLDPASDQVDQHGFPNRAVPDQADVVTIGSHQTAGLLLPEKSTWPGVFGARTNQSVYNLAVPGYGPQQYQQLVREALKLKPRQVIIGLNLSADLGKVNHPEGSDWTVSEATFRQKLQRYTALGGLASQIVHDGLTSSEPRFEIAHSTNPISISHRQVAANTKALNYDTQITQRNLQELVSRLKSATDECRKAGAALTVLLIPTPEFVCGRSVDSSTLAPAVQTMLDNEEKIRDHLLQTTSSAGIFVIDAFPVMVKAAAEQQGVFDRHRPDRLTVHQCEAFASALSQSGSAVTN